MYKRRSNKSYALNIATRMRLDPGEIQLKNFFAKIHKKICEIQLKIKKIIKIFPHPDSFHFGQIYGAVSKYENPKFRSIISFCFIHILYNT